MYMLTGAPHTPTCISSNLLYEDLVLLSMNKVCTGVQGLFARGAVVRPQNGRDTVGGLTAATLSMQSPCMLMLPLQILTPPYL